MSRRRRSVYLDDEVWSALALIAAREDRSVNGVVRLAVGAYLAEQGVGGLPDAARAALAARLGASESPDGSYRDAPPWNPDGSYRPGVAVIGKTEEELR